MKRVALCLLALLLSHALAVDSAMFKELIDFQGWLQEFDAHLGVYRDEIFKLAYALAVVGAMVGAVAHISRGQADVLDLVGRMMLAGILLSVAPSVNAGVVDLWDGARATATEGLKSEYEEAAKAFDEIGKASIDILVTSAIFGSGPANNKLTARAAESVTGWSAYQKVRDKMANVINLALPMLMVAVLFMFFLLVMSGVAITLAGVVLPLGAGLITFPGGTGMSLISSYARVTLSSLLLILLFPVIMSAVFSLTATRPANRLAENLRANKTHLDEVVSSLEGATGNLSVQGVETQLAELNKTISEHKHDPAQRKNGGVYGTLPVTTRPFTDAGKAKLDTLTKRLVDLKESRETMLKAYEEQVAGAMSSGLTQFGKDLNAWVMSMIFLMVMLLIGIFVLFKFESYVATLVGGLVLGAAGALTTLAFAAGATRFAGLGGFGGGGGAAAGGALGDAGTRGAHASVDRPQLNDGAGSGHIVPSHGPMAGPGTSSYAPQPGLGNGPAALGDGSQRALPPPKS